ncbi:hypothetical protein [Devosia sp. SL43]|uniref:hypothetical protein n=1 Tax=Devosia sp. SL43 TaxID=2806348 RepID=UPI001F46D76E|nr:hypothetical protein [Devosia sp. SL43]UJW85876.1 hypothetical protein IM737_00815 [Devosia sp. SL43]
MAAAIADEVKQITLALTVTSGRSGTKLLTVLLCECLGLAAQHEPAPRANYVMRSLLSAPTAAPLWLIAEKLPAMLAAARNSFYAETSHLFCKGLIEPIIDLGIKPKLILLSRPAREVALSLFQMNVIPERTENGRLVLLGPADKGIQNYGHWSDYQLCYWYAREIESMQNRYRETSALRNIDCLSVSFHDLGSIHVLERLSTFLTGSKLDERAKQRLAGVMAINQNSRRAASGREEDRTITFDPEREEAIVDETFVSARLSSTPQNLG